jgi:hypothetical protein
MPNAFNFQMSADTVNQSTFATTMALQFRPKTHIRRLLAIAANEARSESSDPRLRAPNKCKMP